MFKLSPVFDCSIISFIIYTPGYVAPWSGRFYSLWDTGYAKIHIPIIASVSEHQPTPWSSFFFDLHVLACAFPAGIWFCIQKTNDERVFGKFIYFRIFNMLKFLVVCVCLL